MTPTMSLSETSARVGDSVTVSGTTSPEAWVPLKVVDGAGNIVVFDATKANETGSYSITFKVPDGASGTLTVVVGEGDNVVNQTDGTDQPAPGRRRWRWWRRWWFRRTTAGYL